MYTDSLVFCSFAAVVPEPWVIGVSCSVAVVIVICCICVVLKECDKCKREAAQTSQSTGNNRSPSTVSPGGSNPGPTVANEPPGQKQEHPANPGPPPPYEGVEKVV